MFLDFEHPILSTDPKCFIKSNSGLNDLTAFTSPEVASTASFVKKLKSRVGFSQTELESDPDVVLLEPEPYSEAPEKPENVEIEIVHDEVNDASQIRVSQPDPDLVLNWTDDLEISFRFLGDRRVNPAISFPLYPAPENLKKIPSVEYLNMR